MPDPVSINVTSCIFRGRPYALPPIEAARKLHACRYFDEDPLAAVCRTLGDAATRRGRFGWFCADVEPRVRLAEQVEAKAWHHARRAGDSKLVTTNR